MPERERAVLDAYRDKDYERVLQDFPCDVAQLSINELLKEDKTLFDSGAPGKVLDFLSAVEAFQKDPQNRNSLCTLARRYVAIEDDYDHLKEYDKIFSQESLCGYLIDAFEEMNPQVENCFE